ncbi:MAG: GNAT family N-acetyltransferase [Planctomycetota bacterium]|jgi:ribosomal protein S18 acetylase RimI-like enzyme|nr:GNAT family N-acetyltransferase [Planctomycetota bacterium]
MPVEGIPGLCFRPGRAADFPVVLAIQRQAYQLKEVPLYGPDLPPLKETVADLAREVEEGENFLLALISTQETGERVVGSLRYHTEKEGWLHFGRLAVDPGFQGRGIAQALIRALEERHPEVKGFNLECGENSQENRHIYEKLGYRETGITYQIPQGPICREMRKAR